MPAKRRSPAKKSSSTKFSAMLTHSLDDIGDMIEGHKEMIDSIQEVAIELTGTFITLHNLTVKYAKKANDILDAILPVVESLPIIPKKIKKLLTDMEKYTQNIIDDSKGTAKTIKDVNLGLKTGDIQKLKSHTGDLKLVTKNLTSLLPKA